ncbi:PLP-dependent aminotransferase family protein [Hathewaya histolytica]|uniref:Putative GntR family transcriptional regulator n=1 Tax=Hathewaya histolytica TaxID=1498 RepID=A0A4U9RKF4_HATHI|nr:PLP-dependent aminotransferase family protein [Hathewaya histolytica]VTQ89320.1 putative GntR family transcriptional regulator [Hathewaya histolytica]
MNFNFSTRIDNINTHELGDFLKLAEKSDIISFAGGFPASEMFPISQLKEISINIIDNYSNTAFQYGATEGYTPLRHTISQIKMPKFGVKSSLKNIMITSGAQQGLDLSAKLFIDKGDNIICERPTYLGALSAFKAYEPNILEVPMESDGMDLNLLENLLKKHKNIKFIYTIPDFQNPTGITMSKTKREYLAFLASKYKVPIIEDSPYSELSFEGRILPSIKSFDKNGYVIYLGTFSKTLCPAFRIGWVCAEEDLIQKYILCKQGADLQPSTFNQIITYEYLKKYDLDSHINKLRGVYKNRGNVILNAIANYLPSYISTTYPEGGIFTWIEIHNKYTSKEFLNRALDVQVAFVLGDAFFANGNDNKHLRVNFSSVNEEKIFEGIQRLGKNL